MGRANKIKDGQLPSSQKTECLQKHKEILEELIYCLVQSPVMACTNFQKPFSLHIDASHDFYNFCFILK